MKLFFVSCRLSIVSKCSPVGSSVKNLPANAWAVGWIPGLGRSPGEGNGNPLQYSCLENQDRGAWRLQSMELGKSGTQLSNWTTTTTIVSNRGKFLLSFKRKKGFQVAQWVKKSTCNAGDTGDKSDPWMRKIPRKRAWQPTPVFLTGESRGQRSLAVYSPEGRTESDTTEGTEQVKERHLENSSVFWEMRHGCLKSARG